MLPRAVVGPVFVALVSETSVSRFEDTSAAWQAMAKTTKKKAIASCFIPRIEKSQFQTEISDGQEYILTFQPLDQY